MLTIDQFYSTWADLYEENKALDPKERNQIMREWCLEKMNNPDELEAGVFEKISAWYKLLSTN